MGQSHANASYNRVATPVSVPEAVAGGISGLLTGADKTKLNNTSGVNTGDQTLPTKLSQFTNDLNVPSKTGVGASGTWPIDITGRAYPKRSDGTNINIDWTGQVGQPSWVVGSDDGLTFKAYSPSNFNVTSATKADKLTTPRKINGINFDGTADITVVSGSGLSYTPVEQGGGIGQGVNKIYIGWSATGLKLQVDVTDFGKMWPIDITGISADSDKLDGLHASSFAKLTTNIFSGAQSITEINKGTVSTGTVTFNHLDGNVQKLVVAGNITLAFSNWPAGNIYADMLLKLTDAGSFTVTMPAITWILPDKRVVYSSISAYLTALGRSPATMRSNAQEGNIPEMLYIWTDNGGVTLYGKII